MGIVLRQSFRNTIIIYGAFLIGGVNTLWFYPELLGSKFYGLVVYLLATSNIMMPFLAFGAHFTMIKFFSSYKTKEQKDRFLSSQIFLPLLIALPIGFFWDYFHEWIMSAVVKENRSIENYTFSIYIISVCCAYFEFFYSWTKVHLNTVFGNVLKELWNRAVVTILLVSVYCAWISKIEFIYYLTGAYILRTFVMMFYAFKVYIPKFHFKFPDNFSEIMKYSGYIILAGSAGAILLDIDKNMIPGKDTIEQVAFYTVAVFMGSFIEAPSRAMTQILQPLTSKSLNDANMVEVESLYKKSSINLFLVGGLFFLLVNCGVHELFKLMPEKGYAGGELVVLMISLAKLYTMFLGNNGAIITNSKFYRITLPIGVGSAVAVYLLNRLFYYELEMGTNGLALATLIIILIFNSVKLYFVKSKFSMSPFTDKSWKLFVVILILLVSFYFWNFSIPVVEIFDRDISPIFNIIFKSFLIIVCYLFLIYKLSISKQINSLLRKYIKL